MQYNEQLHRKYEAKIDELICQLPPLCEEFFRGTRMRLEASTRESYAYDFVSFFKFFTEYDCSMKGKATENITYSDLENLSIRDLECYVADMSHDKEKGPEIASRTISRRIAAIKSLYGYCQRTQRIEKNPSALLERPKINTNPITYLEPDESLKLLDAIATAPPQGASKQKKMFYELNALRDYAIVMMFLGTGLRVSELVSIDMQNLDLDMRRVIVRRKGGDVKNVYFSDEVAEVLREYLEKRRTQKPIAGHENALFLSAQRKRISVRSVEILVKKYAEKTGTTKDIHPHVLRATYGTILYRETRDLLLVSKSLNHSSTDVTSKHYSNLRDEELRASRNIVKIKDV